MTTPFQFDQGFRSSFFADNPGVAFQTSITQAGLPRNMVDFFRNRTSTFLKRFEGAFGQQLDEFGRGDLNPLGFFTGQAGLENPFDFRQEFLRFSPRERGENPSIFNPKTRRIFR